MLQALGRGDHHHIIPRFHDSITVRKNNAPLSDNTGNQVIFTDIELAKRVAHKARIPCYRKFDGFGLPVDNFIQGTDVVSMALT